MSWVIIPIGIYVRWILVLCMCSCEWKPQHSFLNNSENPNSTLFSSYQVGSAGSLTGTHKHAHPPSCIIVWPVSVGLGAVSSWTSTALTCWSLARSLALVWYFVFWTQGEDDRNDKGPSIGQFGQHVRNLIYFMCTIYFTNYSCVCLEVAAIHLVLNPSAISQPSIGRIMKYFE